MLTMVKQPVNKLLEQSEDYDAHSMLDERVMDNNAIERERGITILAKTRQSYIKIHALTF